MNQKIQKRKYQHIFSQLPITEQEVILELEKNCGREIPRYHPNEGYSIRNNHIVELLLPRYNISKIPDNVHQLQHLILLQITQNNIKTIPENLFKLKNLQYIYLNNNKISIIPDNIDQMKSMRYIYLHNNIIHDIPKNLFNLINIEIIALDNNQISTLPDQFDKIIYLERLSLSGNNLKKLPESIKTLKNLKKLNINANKFTKIPDWLTELKDLEELNIADNNISVLPAEVLSTLPNLTINFEGNSIRTLAGLNERQLIDVLMRYHKHINPEKFEKFPAQLTHKGMWFLNRVFESANPNVSGFEGERVFGLFPDILSQILNYYQKTPIQLSQQYADNTESLTADEKKRLAWEASIHEREILELKLPPTDPILTKINKRLSIPLKNGLKIMK